MKRRFSVAILATILFGVVSLGSTPSTPAITALGPVLDGRSGWASQYGLPQPERVEMQRRVVNTLPYGSILIRSAERNRIDSLLLAALVEVESGFAANAISPQGARGLMQVRPSTASALGHEGDLLDPHTNVEVGCRYLGSLLRDFDGDLALSLAAYNAGPSAVLRHNGIPPYRETRVYVRKVLGRYQVLQREASALEAGIPVDTGSYR